MLSKTGRKILIGLIGGILLSACPALVLAQGDTDKPAESITKASYVGSDACKICHAKVYAPWSTSPHSKTLAQESAPAEMKGCESCHGPASVHVGSGAQNKPSIPRPDDATATNALCGNCHMKSDSSKAPKEWQNLSQSNWTRSTHGRKGLSCLQCHTGHPNGNDKALSKPAKELCTGCHASVLEDSPGKKAAYTHSPVATGQCVLCHDPHGAPDRRMVSQNIGKVCEQCHKVTDPKIATAHSNYPVSGTNCVSCHDPHSHNRQAKLVRAKQHMPFKSRQCETCHTKPDADGQVGLVKPAKELCFTCHPSSVLMPQNEKAHLPAKEGLCISCHDPHAGNAKGIMKTRQAYACFTCHSKVEGDTVEAHRHKILDSNLNCSLCHKAHSSPQESLLVKDEMALCQQCHKHSMSHPMGAKGDGSAVKDLKTGKTVTCSSCHYPHGAQYAVLTKGEKNRELCLLCHGMEH